jgi:hypothetical protein
MPTIVQFNGGESLMLEEDFDHVNQQLAQHEAGLFNRLVGSNEIRVSVYRASIAYIQEHIGEPPEPPVAGASG